MQSTFHCCQISINLNFLDRFVQNPLTLNLMKLRTVGAELLHADGQTDRQTDLHDEANNLFWKFCERTQKNSYNSNLRTI
jgi:hypothetical protein